LKVVAPPRFELGSSGYFIEENESLRFQNPT
jgi:hypothetical protein